MSGTEEAGRGSENRVYYEPAEVEGHRTRPVGPSVEGAERRPKRSDDEDGPDVEGHRRQF